MTLEQTDTSAKMETYISDLKKFTFAQKVVVFILCVLFIVLIICLCFVSQSETTHLESPFTVHIDRVKFSGTPKNATLNVPTSSESVFDSIERIPTIDQIQPTSFSRIPPLPKLGREFTFEEGSFEEASFEDGSGQINRTT